MVLGVALVWNRWAFNYFHVDFSTSLNFSKHMQSTNQSANLSRGGPKGLGGRLGLSRNTHKAYHFTYTP